MRDKWKLMVPRPVARRVKIARSRAFEALGSDRYTWAAVSDLDRQMLTRLGAAPGVFLEIGGNDGYSQSNTYHLERMRGWRGILIEPLPNLHRMSRWVRPRSRCYNVACVGPGGPAFVEIEDRNLSSVTLGMQDVAEEAGRLTGGRRLTVPTATLSAVIDHSGEAEINFMSVDVEGAELEVLSGLDLDRHAPGLLLVETKHPEALDARLDGHLSRVAQLSYHDHLYERVRR